MRATYDEMKLLGTIGAIWGLGGVCALLLFAIYRLTPKAIHAFEVGLNVWQWVLLGVVVVFMLYSEGYRGFQKRFSPRTAARVHYLAGHPTFLRVFFAPLFCMGYFFATKRTKIIAWVFPFALALLVYVVHLLEQPWRGIIDAGVVLGLTWGVVSLVLLTVRTFVDPAYRPSPEVPAAAT